jgi:glycosyltransferase involved in cell wall biosynthesis
MPLLSIIIPTFNRAALLLETLNSVRSQPFDDFELIIVDDGSTDETAKVLATEATDQRWGGKLRIYLQNNAGPGAARNVAIGHARGEYCFFLDSDDLLFPWSLSVVAKAIALGSKPSVIMGREIRFNTPNEHAAVQNEPLQTTQWADLYTLARLGPTGTLVARTDLIRSVGGFFAEPCVGEDADLMLRLGTAPNLIKIESPGLYGFRTHDKMFSSEPHLWSKGAIARIQRHEAGGYPGGELWRGRVRRMVAYNVAWSTLHCMKVRSFAAGFELYLKTFWWQARGGELDYLLKTPFRLLLCMVGLWPLQAKHRAGKL